MEVEEYDWKGGTGRKEISKKIPRMCKVMNEGWKMKKSKRSQLSFQTPERFKDRIWQEHREWEGVLKAKGLNAKQLSPYMENGLDPGIYHPDNSEGSNRSRKTEKLERTTVAYMSIHIPRINPSYCGTLLERSWHNCSTFLHFPPGHSIYPPIYTELPLSAATASTLTVMRQPWVTRHTRKVAKRKIKIS